LQEWLAALHRNLPARLSPPVPGRNRPRKRD
jgi:hypothetical protein